MIWRILAGIIGGFVVTFLITNFAKLIGASEAVVALIFLAGWTISIGIAMKSVNAGRAWRQLLIISSVLSFIMPLAVFIRSTKSTEAGEVIGGLFATGIFSVLFFMLGIAFLVAGLLTGRQSSKVARVNNEA